ncbi:MAG: sugar ABC transporter permease [Ardenticatenaceae bacterium]|nr:sugar ABC transporter permease [Ardenticatenaceae bacterium]
MRQKKIYPYLLIAPALLFITAVTLYPTIFSVYLSLNRSRRGVLEFVGLRNFEIIFNSGDFWESFRLTLIYGFLFVGLVMVFAFLLALIFNRGLLFGGVYMSIIFIPWMLSEIVSSVMFRWMFLPEIGIAQRLLGPIFGDITFLGNDAGAMGVVIGATIWRSVAFAMLLLLAGLQTIPGELTEAASIDGANRWQAFWKVTWPLVLPTTQVTIVFLTIQAINAAGMFLSITNGGPGRATEVLSLYMYREAIVFFNFGYGAALAVILFLLNAVLAIVYIRSLRSQVTYA